jgi:predicted AlkP superfamily phosphohydrolase/phosphomutase
MNPVVAIGIDAGDPNLLERLSQQGHLPTLSRLRRSGAYGPLENLQVYRAETAWTAFLTGVRPERTGFWSRRQRDPGRGVGRTLADGAKRIGACQPFR